jgi:DNA-binding response OmpR family regulator
MPHVLVIEDSYLFGQLVADIARLAGARTVDIVETQQAAEESAAKQLPTIIIADVKLFQGSGPAAVRQLRRHVRHVPALFVTGNAGECQDYAQTDTVLEKPVSVERLLDVITGLLSKAVAANAEHE